MKPNLDPLDEAVLPRHVLIVADLPGRPEHRRRTMSSLRVAAPGAEIIDVRAGGSLSDVAERTAGSADDRHVLVVTDHVLAASGSVARAVRLMEEDQRIATISFLSNAAGPASVRTAGLTEQLDAHALTVRLRSRGPAPTAVPVPAPTGALTLLSRHALGACGGLLAGSTLSSQALVVEVALRANRQGFISVLDTGTFVIRPADSGPRQPDPLDAHELPELERLHPAIVPGLADARSEASPLALALPLAVAKLRGLTVTIDGTSLRREEMGTQVHTTSLIRALAAHDEISRVAVVVNGDIPPYARAPLRHPKIEVVRAEGLDFSIVPTSDIVHRPFQPDTHIPFDLWRRRAPRVVVGLQDLILYQVGSYFGDGSQWSAFRSMLRHAAAASDAVTVISNDVREQVIAEALPVDPTRLFAVELGADHLHGDEACEPPRQLAERGAPAAPFMLVLGTDYPHKNRDVAVAAWRLVRRTHPDLDLVMAGPSMPFGPGGAPTTDDPTDDGLVVLPEVPSSARNWLLRHAEIVLYPTSAEGFGFVPFEAARFGTPTLSVPFGPLREIYGALPVTADSWTAEAFAAAAESLLSDPDARRAQVDAVTAAATRYTWAATADRLVDVYRTTLSRRAVQLGVLDAAHRELGVARSEAAMARHQLDAITASRSYRLALRIAAAARAVRR